MHLFQKRRFLPIVRSRLLPKTGFECVAISLLKELTFTLNSKFLYDHRTDCIKVALLYFTDLLPLYSEMSVFFNI